MATNQSEFIASVPADACLEVFGLTYFDMCQLAYSGVQIVTTPPLRARLSEWPFNEHMEEGIHVPR